MIFLLSSLISVIPVVEAAEQETDSEQFLISISAHSSVVNEERVRDGIVGVMNQAQLDADACSSTCTDFTYAAVIINATYPASVSLVDLSLEYETWGETNQLGEDDPYGLHIYAWIFHKFGNTTVTLQTSTTGYGNMQVTEIGEYAVGNDSTIEVWIVVSHESTSSLSDEASMRAHELYMSQGSPDDDSDGVANNNDECPSTPSSQLDEVDGTGCSSQERDEDEDGVLNAEDMCPETDLGLTVDYEGCADNQKDSDGDGVTDDQDQCASTPNGESIDGNGCSASQKDSDDDGVTDDQDQCASTPNGESVDGNGCSASQKDSDGDGVTDDQDSCSDTNPGAVVDSTGCPSSSNDEDNDGVVDSEDAFPNDLTQWDDTDNDGYGDNASGVDPDECPSLFGESYIDRYGCIDSDSDGYSDDGDDFPMEISQWSDSDGDGFGDNSTGLEPDAFPDDSTQWEDQDGDGYGDESSGQFPDACPATVGESFKDVYGCPDVDSDGISNEGDECPSTGNGMLVDSSGCSTGESDSDGDGVADSQDNCPNTPIASNVDVSGCIITNGTGSNDSTSDGSGLTGKDDSKGALFSVAGFDVDLGILTVLGTGLLGFLSYVVARKKNKRSGKYLTLARSANNLRDISALRTKMDKDLSKGKIDHVLISNVENVLQSKEEKMQQNLGANGAQYNQPPPRTW
jgi:hypothetical protein